MRRKWMGMLTLAVGLVGCDTTPPPPPPGAEKAETELKIDEGGGADGQSSDDLAPEKKDESGETPAPKGE